MKCSRIRALIPTVLFAMAVATIAGPARAVPDRAPFGVTKPAVPVDWVNKKIAFRMQNKPWREMLDWFADQTRLPWDSAYPLPKGTFTFIPPTFDGGKSREYTLVEIYDIINEIMQGSTKHTLIRREKSIMVFPIDDWKGCLGLMPCVKLRELPGRGRTEIVQVVVKLAPDVLPLVKRCLDGDGIIRPLDNDDGRFVVRASVASLVFILENVPSIPMTDLP
jgi:hypothetical protein